MNLQTILLIVIVVFVSSCTKTNPVSYQSAIDNCIEVVKKEIEKDSTIIGRISKDCIIGCSVPELNSSTTSGIKVDNSYFAGKPGMINFWFEACPPCVEEIPHLNQLVDSLGTDRFYFLTIGKDSREEIESFLIEHPWKFDHIVNGKDLLKKSFQNPYGYPNTYLVDRDGKIVKSLGQISERNLNEVISDLKSLL